MGRNTPAGIGDDQLDAVVGGTVSTQAAKPSKSVKSKGPEVVEHREGGNRNPG